MTAEFTPRFNLHTPRERHGIFDHASLQRSETRALTLDANHGRAETVALHKPANSQAGCG
jgi:hypothetical protein